MCGAIRHVRAVMLISIINFLPRGLCDQGIAGQPGKVLKVTTQHSNLRLNSQVGGPAVLSLPAARQGRDASRDQAGRNWNDGKAARGSSRKVERGPASKAGTLQDLLLRTAERKPAPRGNTAAPAAYKAVKAADVLRRSAGPVSLKARHGPASAVDTTMTVIRAPAVPFGASERSEAEEEAGGDAFNMLLSWFGGAEASSGEMDEEASPLRGRGASTDFMDDGDEGLATTPGIILRYTACAGLINQHYSHIAALTLAAALKASVVMPPAVRRDSYAKYFSIFKEKNEVEWTPAPLDTLLDVTKIAQTWAAKGITIQMAPALLPFPDMTEPEVAYPLYKQQEYDKKYTVRMHDVYMQNETLERLVSRARKTASHHAKQLLLRGGGAPKPPPYIVLDLPCTFFMLNTQGCLNLTSEVARTLEFSPYLVHLADQVVLAMTDHGSLEYNAVHLRIEKDAKDWTKIMGGPEVVWNAYMGAMKEAAFSDALGLYVASALLTYGDSDGLSLVVDKLTQEGLCSGIHYKEMYLPKNVLQELNSEQSGLLDFLILYRARSFVGFGSSTFSFYVREYRALLGIPKSSTVLVNSSVITTDPIFNAAAVVV